MDARLKIIILSILLNIMWSCSNKESSKLLFDNISLMKDDSIIITRSLSIDEDPFFKNQPQDKLITESKEDSPFLKEYPIDQSWVVLTKDKVLESKTKGYQYSLGGAQSQVYIKLDTDKGLFALPKDVADKFPKLSGKNSLNTLDRAKNKDLFRRVEKLIKVMYQDQPKSNRDPQCDGNIKVYHYPLSATYSHVVFCHAESHRDKVRQRILEDQFIFQSYFTGIFLFDGKDKLNTISAEFYESSANIKGFYDFNGDGYYELRYSWGRHEDYSDSLIYIEGDKLNTVGLYYSGA